ncbi:MAG: hydrogenase maturation nickel metallochaperone HypA [Acidobacteria bacterium]|nr:hydrogenase maturation nickel metallochaperone HypA [Acidobacteriota bacterium]
MHEYSVAQALIDRAAHEARARGALRVLGLTVQVGQLSGVEPDLLLSAYEICRVGTVCQDAALAVGRVDAQWSCPRCAATIAPGDVLRCPRCAAPACLARGGELLLERIEIEVADG